MQAFVLISDSNNAASYCGGTIIKESYILSAAHCFYYKKETALLGNGYKLFVNVYMGTTTKNDPNYIMRTVNLEDIFIHEDYLIGEEVCCRFCLVLFKYTDRTEFISRMEVFGFRSDLKKNGYHQSDIQYLCYTSIVLNYE